MQLCALYAVTDVALVTSLRDGMNLVSYEYVACQSENAGAGRRRIALRCFSTGFSVLRCVHASSPESSWTGSLCRMRSGSAAPFRQA